MTLIFPDDIETQRISTLATLIDFLLALPDYSQGLKIMGINHGEGELSSDFDLYVAKEGDRPVLIFGTGYTSRTYKNERAEWLNIFEGTKIKEAARRQEEIIEARKVLARYGVGLVDEPTEPTTNELLIESLERVFGKNHT
jgi:hypothetical protein